MDSLNGFFHAVGAAALRSDLQLLAASFHGVGHEPALADVVAARFLNVDVLACVQRQDRRGRVPMVRRGDEHRVHASVVQHLPQILLGLGRFAGKLLSGLGRFR